MSKPPDLVQGRSTSSSDSLADGGLHFDRDRAVAAGVRMAEEGADILDVGGESTRFALALPYSSAR